MGEGFASAAGVLLAASPLAVGSGVCGAGVGGAAGVPCTCAHVCPLLLSRAGASAKLTGRPWLGLGAGRSSSAAVDFSPVASRHFAAGT